MDDTPQTIPLEVAENATTAPNGEVVNLLTIEEQVKARIEQMDKIKEAMQPHKEMLDSYLSNDPTYVEHSNLAKKAAQVKSATKKQLLSAPTGANLVDKINLLKDEMKDVQEALSYYLREYQRLTGSNEFEGTDGELRQIIYSAKLVRKTQLNR